MASAAFFEHVGHRLAELVAIALDRRNVGVARQGIGDRRIGHFLQEHRLAHQIDGVLLPEHRLWQAGEAGELVHHLAQVPHLADDRAGQLVEQFAVLLDLAGIAAADAFGGKLDRRQRVLDFVRDAAGNVRPGGLALVKQLAGDVLEGDHSAFGCGGRS